MFGGKNANQTKASENVIDMRPVAAIKLLTLGDSGVGELRMLFSCRVFSYLCC